MSIIDSAKRILSKVFSLKTKPTIGLSFDDNVKLDNIPATPLMQVGKFIEFNKELVHFEVTRVNTIERKIRVCEICTDNEFEISFEFFEYLFHETPVPHECRL